MRIRNDDPEKEYKRFQQASKLPDNPDPVAAPDQLQGKKVADSTDDNTKEDKQNEDYGEIAQAANMLGGVSGPNVSFNKESSELSPTELSSIMSPLEMKTQVDECNVTIASLMALIAKLKNTQREDSLIAKLESIKQTLNDALDFNKGLSGYNKGDVAGIKSAFANRAKKGDNVSKATINREKNEYSSSSSQLIAAKNSGLSSEHAKLSNAQNAHSNAISAAQKSSSQAQSNLTNTPQYKANRARYSALQASLSAHNSYENACATKSGPDLWAYELAHEVDKLAKGAIHGIEDALSDVGHAFDKLGDDISNACSAAISDAGDALHDVETAVETAVHDLKTLCEKGLHGLEDGWDSATDQQTQQNKLDSALVARSFQESNAIVFVTNEMAIQTMSPSKNKKNKGKNDVTALIEKLEKEVVNMIEAAEGEKITGKSKSDGSHAVNPSTETTKSSTTKTSHHDNINKMMKMMMSDAEDLLQDVSSLVDAGEAVGGAAKEKKQTSLQDKPVKDDDEGKGRFHSVKGKK